MAKYKSLKGQPIQVLTADPPAPVEGQVWVVAAPGTASVMKGYALGAGTWASGGNVNQSRSHGGGSGATQTAALFFGGQNPPTSTTTNKTESYNGTSWTEVAEMTTAAHYITGTGTQTASQVAGGNRPSDNNSDKNEIWNGAGWSEAAELNTGRNAVILFGTSTASFGCNGYITAYQTKVESWNGTSWTETTATNYGRYGGMGAGTTAGGLVFGGEGPGSMPVDQRNTEKWDGSSWTEVGDMNTTRSWCWSGGTTNDLAITAGGQPHSANSEQWNGTVWTEVNNLSAAKAYSGGKCGSSADSLYVSGATASPTANNRTAVTEEWTQALATVSFDID